MNKKLIFKGSGVALVTPMDSDMRVDYQKLEEIIEFQISSGTDAIISCGTTGESATLTEEERLKVIEYTIQKVKGRVPVIAGTGSNSTSHALALSQAAQKLKASALLIVTPYYNKTSQKGLIDHYTHIADRVELPIILYNVPSRTGLNIKPETYAVLSKHSRIVATKEASGDISELAKTISLCGSNLAVYSGNDDQTIPVMSLGGIGVISVFANVFPQESHSITEDYLNGKYTSSLQGFLEAIPVMNALFCDVNPIPVKAAMKIIGKSCGECRMPLSKLDDFSEEKLKKTVLDFIKNKH